MLEQWKAIPGYESLYEVSDHGQVRGRKHVLKQERVKKGYRRVLLCNKGADRHWFVHRLVMLAFVGPSSLSVNHKDNCTSNNHLDNLEYVTAQQNQSHSWQTNNRQPPHQGERTHFAKLTDDDVRAIRSLRQTGLTYREIATRFNTKGANVWHICMGRTWKHLLIPVTAAT